MRALTCVLSGLCLLSFAACNEEPPPPPPPAPAPSPKPKPTLDAGTPDGGASDGGVADAGAEGGGAADAGDVDGGAADGDDVDGGDDDAGVSDATAHVTSKPAGATVLLDGQPVGTAPLDVPLVSGRKQVVEVSLDGHVALVRELEPSTGETVNVDAVLKPGVTLEVTSDPPDASVTVNGQLVLAGTPGVTKAFLPGVVEVVVSSPGYDDFTKKLKAKAGAQKLDAKLKAQVKVAVTSSPTGASVTLDGADAGVTPAELLLSTQRTYTLVVTKAGWSTVKKVVKKPDGEPVEFQLVDLELEQLKANVAKALKAYDTANDVLENAQKHPEREAQLEAAEEAMTKATVALEEAESALASAKSKRAR